MQTVTPQHEVSTPQILVKSFIEMNHIIPHLIVILIKNPSTKECKVLPNEESINRMNLEKEDRKCPTHCK
jgi:hypothetical protein